MNWNCSNTLHSLLENIPEPHSHHSLKYIFYPRSRYSNLRNNRFQLCLPRNSYSIQMGAACTHSYLPHYCLHMNISLHQCIRCSGGTSKHRSSLDHQCTLNFQELSKLLAPLLARCNSELEMMTAVPKSMAQSSIYF